MWPSSSTAVTPPDAPAKRPRHDRAYRRCKCPIHAEGTLRIDGFTRKATGETDWEQAEQRKREWEEAGTGTVRLHPAGHAPDRTGGFGSIPGRCRSHAGSARAHSRNIAFCFANWKSLPDLSISYLPNWTSMP